MTPGVLYEGGISIGGQENILIRKIKEKKKKKSNFSPGTLTDANTVVIDKAKMFIFFPQRNTCRKITMTSEVAPHTRY